MSRPRCRRSSRRRSARRSRPKIRRPRRSSAPGPSCVLVSSVALPSTAASPRVEARDRRLEQLAVGLLDRAEHVAAIRLVEAWAASGAPTPRARIAQGRAFLALRLMDRAMARAREVLDGDPQSPEALRLLAEVYLERGWPLKARKPLATLRDAGQDVDDLWARAHQDPARPETTAREIEREGEPDKLLALAASFLATGSFLRATGILERLRRQDPANARVKEFLWGLAGEFGGFDLEAALRATPPVLPDAAEEPEHTESLRFASLPLELEDDGTNFPALFKHGAPPTDAADDTEATQASGMASRDQMGAAGLPEDTPSRAGAPAPEAGHSDTQIMLVLRPGDDKPRDVHRRKEDEDPLRKSLNLREWQQSMGMSDPAGGDLGSDVDGGGGEDLLEEEDQDVVVMTRAGEAQAPDPDPPATFPKPIEVVEKHPLPPSMPMEALEPEEIVGDDAVTVELRDVEIPRAAPSRGPLLLGLAALAALAFLVVVAVAVGTLGARVTASERTDLLRALATQEYDALLQQEGRLEQRARAGDAVDVVDPLAETRLVLWSDWNGDPSRVEAVRASLEGGSGLHPHRLAVLRAEEALARDDVATASAALARERPEDDEERLLFARIAARSGDMARAEEHFDALDSPGLPRYRLARAEVLAAAGETDEAVAIVNALLGERPDHAAARLLGLELKSGTPAEIVTAVDLYLVGMKGRLPPRLEGRAHLLRARAFADMGVPQKALAAAEAGLARDGTNPDLLYMVAGDHAVRNELGASLGDLDTVVAARPGLAAAQAARVVVLLEMDRVEEADRAVKALEERGAQSEVAPTLRTLVNAWGRGEPPPAGLPPLPETPLGRYAAALVAVQAHDPAADAVVEGARAALAASADPFDRRLAPRLAALRASTVPPDRADAVAREAEVVAGDDPIAHVYLGRYYEAVGRRAPAAQHFDRAPQLGPELGIAWYEKGRFYMDARDNFARTGAAWRNYLALAPTGPRAERVKDKLDIR